jgi:hypothetical protein
MTKNKKSDKEADLKKYEDLSGVSLREMNLGLWLAENRRKFLKIIIIFLVAVSAFFFIYSGYNYVVYFLDNQNSLVESSAPASPRQVTQDLQVSSPQVFANNGHYDFAIKLNNLNDKFLAGFKYCFTQAGNDLACGEDFILPGAEKYILALGREFNGVQSEIVFKLTEISYRRIDSHKIPDWENFYFDRLNFSVAGLDFTPASKANPAEKIGLNTLEFTIKNQTSYSYYEAPLNIFLFNGSELVGVNRYSLLNFLAGEERTVRISWPGNLSAVNRAEVRPDVNIMEESVYLKYQGTD